MSSLSMESLFSGSLDLFLVLGPILGYIPQYLDIRRSNKVVGFSPLISFILISSSILRVMFWILKRFELVLLIQSLVMIVAQLTMLELIVRVRGIGGGGGVSSNSPTSGHSIELPEYITNNSSSNSSNSNNNSGNNISNGPPSSNGNNINMIGAPSILDDAFWDWSNLKNYLSLIATLFILMANLVLVNVVFVDSTFITELVGYAAMGLESTLAMPQLYRNFVNKSCAGLSLELVAAWVLGDLFKTVFFLSRGSPLPFIMCGCVQLSVDFGIVSQLYLYSKATHAMAKR